MAHKDIMKSLSCGTRKRETFDKVIPSYLDWKIKGSGIGSSAQSQKRWLLMHTHIRRLKMQHCLSDL